MMYESIARYYDLLHADLTADIGFVLALASQSDGSVLELGCGTGRLLLPLARAGYRVTGLDNSPAMLDRARARLAAEPGAVQERITLVESDMTSLSLPEETGAGLYALALIPYNTLMHLGPAQAQLVLYRLGRYLAVNGRLFIDLPNPMVVAQTPNDQTLALENSLIDPETGDIILQLASNWLEADEQRLHVTWLYDATPAGGGPVQRTVVRVVYHYVYPHQVELWLNEAGFRLEALLGDYNEAPFNEESERMLVLARWPGVLTSR